MFLSTLRMGVYIAEGIARKAKEKWFIKFTLAMLLSTFTKVKRTRYISIKRMAFSELHVMDVLNQTSKKWSLQKSGFVPSLKKKSSKANEPVIEKLLIFTWYAGVESKVLAQRRILWNAITTAIRLNRMQLKLANYWQLFKIRKTRFFIFDSKRIMQR